MTAATATLSDFLLARIAEDEAMASRVADFEGYEEVDPPHWTPARVLAECEAKRRIVEQWEMTQPPASGADYAVEQELEITLMYLAAIYADHHPDYREEWRP